MNKREKLDDEKLASVSGGFVVDQPTGTTLSAGEIAMLESGQCPCGGTLSAYLTDFGFKCNTCAVVYQKIRGTTWVSCGVDHW